MPQTNRAGAPLGRILLLIPWFITDDLGPAFGATAAARCRATWAWHTATPDGVVDLKPEHRHACAIATLPHRDDERRAHHAACPCSPKPAVLANRPQIPTIAARSSHDDNQWRGYLRHGYLRRGPSPAATPPGGAGHQGSF